MPSSKVVLKSLERVSDSYSPAKFVAVAKDAVSGSPDPDHAGTSHVERKNGSLRQWCKRLTRLTYSFSKSCANLHAALALHFAYYNVCSIHGSPRVASATAPGIPDLIWTLEDLMA